MLFCYTRKLVCEGLLEELTGSRTRPLLPSEIGPWFYEDQCHWKYRIMKLVRFFIDNFGIVIIGWIYLFIHSFKTPLDVWVQCSNPEWATEASNKSNEEPSPTVIVTEDKNRLEKDRGVFVRKN